MKDQRKGRAPATIWAYAFQIAPPPTRSRLRAVGALLDREHLVAHDASRTWTGRLIHGARMTSILVVSDSLARSRKVNRLLEAEFRRLKVGFSVTEPVALPGSISLGRRRRAKS